MDSIGSNAKKGEKVSSILSSTYSIHYPSVILSVWKYNLWFPPPSPSFHLLFSSLMFLQSFETNTTGSNTSNSQKVLASLIEGRSGIFGSHKDSIFLDVASGKGSSKGNVYTVTNKGLLCCFTASTRILEKWVNLKATGVYGISLTERYIACACSNGIIRYSFIIYADWRYDRWYMIDRW